MKNKGMYYKEFSMHFGGRHDVFEHWALESKVFLNTLPKANIKLKKKTMGKLSNNTYF